MCTIDIWLDGEIVEATINARMSVPHPVGDAMHAQVFVGDGDDRMAPVIDLDLDLVNRGEWSRQFSIAHLRWCLNRDRQYLERARREVTDPRCRRGAGDRELLVNHVASLERQVADYEDRLEYTENRWGL